MPVDRWRAAGLKIGLGSDVAAGPELNMWMVMRAAVEQQRARTFYEKDARALKPIEAFHLATFGGAEALGQSRETGTLDVGKEADLLMIELDKIVPYGKAGPRPHELSPQDLVALCIYRGGPQATAATYVRGRRVYAAGDPPPQLTEEAGAGNI